MTRRAFTILEVVISMSMLALIAVPAVGLAAMVAKKTQADLTAGTATELGNRLRAAIAADDAFTSDLDGEVFFATKDLNHIERASATSISDSDRYFRLTLSVPDGYTFGQDDLYRLYVCRMVWPDRPEAGQGTNDVTTLLSFRR